MAYALRDFEPAANPHQRSSYASPRVRMAQGKIAIAEVRLSQAETELRLMLVEAEVSGLEERLSHLEAELDGFLRAAPCGDETLGSAASDARASSRGVGASPQRPSCPAPLAP